MKRLKIEFRTRMIGYQTPDVYTEEVDVESDSTPEEQDQQIREHYNKYYISGRSNISQTYPYIILQ
jgi:hypothetical protein